MPLSGLTPRSDSARIRNMLDEIENALSKGASREDVWKTLKAEQGLTVTFDGFCKALQRARARRLKTEKPDAHLPAKQTPQSNEVTSKSLVPPTNNGEETVKEDGGDDVPPSTSKDRIRTSKDFKQIRDMDFSELDDKYK